MKSRHTKHQSACFRNAADDEPVFVLRARDLSSDDVVQKWIEINMRRLGPNHPKILDAIEVRNEMASWPIRKHAD